MPLFVFLILGMLQLALMHQARVMAKYAAYKAARVGSIHNAKPDAMLTAAKVVLLPVTGRQNTDSFFNASSGKFAASWSSAKTAASPAPVKLTICEPNNVGPADFDDPNGPLKHYTRDWQVDNKGRLAIQLTFYYQLVIPFVNGIIWHIVTGKEHVDTMRTLRLGNGNRSPKAAGATGNANTWAATKSYASGGRYFLPIRASWSMRMQSNFLSKYPLPKTNDCKVAWK